MSNSSNSGNSSNQNQHQETGTFRTDAAGHTRSIQEYELPDGRIARIGIRMGNTRDESVDATESRQKFWETVHPPELTRSLERETASLTSSLDEITGYDREGKPLYKLTGQARYVAEVKLSSKSFALEVAKKDRAKAERIQAQKKIADEKRLVEIEKAAQAEAQRLIDQAEVDRRAKQIAAKAGASSGGAL